MKALIASYLKLAASRQAISPHRRRLAGSGVALICAVALIWFSATGGVRQPDESGCSSWQQWGTLYSRQVAYNLHATAGGAGANAAAPVKASVQVTGVPWLRLEFSQANLGEAGYLLITSLEDGQRQRLDAQALAEWGNHSAYFNGDAVEIVLVNPNPQTEIFYEVKNVTVGIRTAEIPTLGPLVADGPLSQCGASDDRVPEVNQAIGRIAIHNRVTELCPTTVTVPADCDPMCTGWIAANGILVSAGHCFVNTTTGVLEMDSNDIIEFNVPASDADGTPNFGSTDDQYPIRVDSSLRYNFNIPEGGNNCSIGRDWAVFTVSKNPDTGLFPGEAYGEGIRIDGTWDNTIDDIRVSGYGIDSGTRNQTLQTEVGPYVGETTTTRCGRESIVLEYIVDTESANSGSPVLMEPIGYALGAHTNAGCNEAAGDGNRGTSFALITFLDALQYFPGSNIVYVDFLTKHGFENGTLILPYSTLQEGLANVTLYGGKISLYRGVYNEDPLTISQPITLTAPVGMVQIGQ